MILSASLSQNACGRTNSCRPGKRREAASVTLNTSLASDSMTPRLSKANTANSRVDVARGSESKSFSSISLLRKRQAARPRLLAVDLRPRSVQRGKDNPRPTPSITHSNPLRQGRRVWQRPVDFSHFERGGVSLIINAQQKLQARRPQGHSYSESRCCLSIRRCALPSEGESTRSTSVERKASQRCLPLRNARIASISAILPTRWHACP